MKSEISFEESIAYIAGLLEGEGSFNIRGTSPGIQICMTDLDTIENLKRMINSDGKITVIKANGNKKELYMFWVGGDYAAILMMQILPFMSARRSLKINEILEIWKKRKLGA